MLKKKREDYEQVTSRAEKKGTKVFPRLKTDTVKRPEIGKFRFEKVVAQANRAETFRGKCIIMQKEWCRERFTCLSLYNIPLHNKYVIPVKVEKGPTSQTSPQGRTFLPPCRGWQKRTSFWIDPPTAINPMSPPLGDP